MTLRNTNKHFWRSCWGYKPSSYAKKRQQAFLAPLLGMDLKTLYLVIAFRNANKHFLRRCRGRHID